MPITFSGRSINTGTLSPMIPIVANNPAFKVQIVPVDGRYEEKAGREKSDDDTQNAIKIGDYVSGEEISGTKESGKKVAGKVLQVLKNGEDIYAYKILDGDGEDTEIDPTTAYKEDPSNESYVLSYESWLTESKQISNEII
jgi:hypothetical protein